MVMDSSAEVVSQTVTNAPASRVEGASPVTVTLTMRWLSVPKDPVAVMFTV